MKSAGDISKRSWIDTAKAIEQYHLSHLKDNLHWTVRDTASALNRSLGSVSQYLSIASWVRTHENQIRRLETMKEAVDWIKEHKRQLILGRIE